MKPLIKIDPVLIAGVEVNVEVGTKEGWWNLRMMYESNSHSRTVSTTSDLSSTTTNGCLQDNFWQSSRGV
jgi:hypothetical protein